MDSSSLSSTTNGNMSAHRSWKRLFLIGASVGAGFALMLALIVGGVICYNSRPKPVKPWDTSALKATYDYVDTEGENKTLVFHYIIENATRVDYKLESADNVVLASRIQHSNSLSVERDENVLKIEWPVFIPAGQRVTLALHVGYPYPGKVESFAEMTSNELENYRKAVAHHVSEKLPNLNGFVLFDQTNRYQVNLPKGW